MAERWMDRIALLAFAVSGCVVAQPARPVMVAQHHAVEAHAFDAQHLGPPPPVPAPPPPMALQAQAGAVGNGAPGQAWVDGHFNLQGGRYEWEQGHWQAPPAPGAHWQQPSWHDGQWFPGFWTQQPGVPPTHAQGGPWNPGWNAPQGALGPGALAAPAAAAVPVAMPVAQAAQPLVNAARTVVVP